MSCEAPKAINSEPRTIDKQDLGMATLSFVYPKVTEIRRINDKHRTVAKTYGRDISQRGSAAVIGPSLVREKLTRTEDEIKAATESKPAIPFEERVLQLLNDQQNPFIEIDGQQESKEAIINRLLAREGRRDRIMTGKTQQEEPLKEDPSDSDRRVLEIAQNPQAPLSIITKATRERFYLDTEDISAIYLEEEAKRDESLMAKHIEQEHIIPDVEIEPNPAVTRSAGVILFETHPNGHTSVTQMNREPSAASIS